MIKKGIVFAIVLIAMIASPALAATTTPTIKILPESGPNVEPDGTIDVPCCGVDAAVSIGLAAKYVDFTTGSPFSQVVTDSSNVVVAGTSQSGALGASPDTELEHWTPTASDIGKTFTLTAEASNMVGKRTQKVTVTAPLAPVPELKTGLLTAVGLIGVLGLVRYRRRKND